MLHGIRLVATNGPCFPHSHVEFYTSRDLFIEPMATGQVCTDSCMCSCAHGASEALALLKNLISACLLCFCIAEC